MWPRASSNSKRPRGCQMKTNSSTLLLAVFVPVMAFMSPTALPAETTAAKTTPWTVQVDKVDSGDISLEPAFQIAIYENLLVEVGKTKRFKAVLRDGDRHANDVSDLLILKTTVQKYTAGSETRRAVTTVSGATKLTVRSQLCARDGALILERTVSGNVRFMGSNLRATHNLAHNVAKTIKQSSLPEPRPLASLQNGPL
jgi:hypothetical protein